MNKLSISISSEISNIVKVENFVETFTDYFALPSVLYGKISLSVIEAVNNAILSGNKRQPDKMVSLVAEKTDKQFKVTVSDEGEGFDYEVIPDPTLPDNINKIYNRYIKDLIRTFKHDIIMRITVYNALGDLCDLSCQCLYGSCILSFCLDPVLLHQISVRLLAFTDRISNCNNLIFLHIYHRILLHQTGIILQCNEIGRFTGNI